MKLRSLLKYRKDPRFVATVPLAILIITIFIYYLIQRAKELSPGALSSRLLLFVLWNINLILILGIVFVLLRSLIKLVLERKQGILGSRFRTKLVATYIATSLVPIILLFVVATDLLRVSIDRWFNMPVRTLLSNSEKIAQIAENRIIADTAGAAEEIARAASEDVGDVEGLLRHVRQFHNVDLVGVYRNGAVVRLIVDPGAPVHEISEPSARFFEEVRISGVARRIENTPGGKWIRVAIRSGSRQGDFSGFAGSFVPAETSRLLDQNVIAHREFQQLDSQKLALKASQTSLFLTATLSILFGALWTAIFISRRITVPIQALAEGTRTLAGGNYQHRIGVAATDEFGLLIGSFNSMAGQLEQQRQALTDSNLEMSDINQRLGEERAYLSTILESVSTGIIAFGENLELLSVNRAAHQILHLDPDADHRSLEELFAFDLSPIRDYVAELRVREPRSREITLFRNGEIRYLELSAAPLEQDRKRAGWVVALEDLTQLVQAQKLAAWSEAARRIAHEIKNPLTPIQLSAERIARKFASGDPNMEKIISEGCQTIVTEVGQLKRMVDEFSRFARMPAVHLKQTEMSEIFDQLARLYDDVKQGVTVRVECERPLPAVVDPEQIRRALINLLDNAIEATSTGEIVITGKRRDRMLVLTVSDPGRGVADRDKEKLFIPYFSTKQKGTGLGLAIVHRIVSDHDGRITVQDNRPAGTRFEIEIP